MKIGYWGNYWSTNYWGNYWPGGVIVVEEEIILRRGWAEYPELEEVEPLIYQFSGKGLIRLKVFSETSVIHLYSTRGLIKLPELTADGLASLLYNYGFVSSGEMTLYGTSYSKLRISELLQSILDEDDILLGINI